jgi:hypothetical protein
MQNNFREQNRKSYIRLRMVYDFTMAGLILAMGFIFCFGDRFGLSFIGTVEPVMRYGFGALCLVYGGFRVYRAIKHDY